MVTSFEVLSFLKKSNVLFDEFNADHSTKLSLRLYPESNPATESVLFAVFDSEGNYRARVTLTRLSRRVAMSSGLWVSEKYRNLGLSKVLFRLMAHFADNIMEFSTLVAFVGDNNKIQQSRLAKLGWEKAVAYSLRSELNDSAETAHQWVYRLDRKAYF